jgi:hypothetical protein
VGNYDIGCRSGGFGDDGGDVGLYSLGEDTVDEFNRGREGWARKPGILGGYGGVENLDIGVAILNTAHSSSRI